MDLKLDLWPKQQSALTSLATELLFGGSAGPGKSHLGRVALISWCVEIPGLQCFLFRRRYSDLVDGHMKGPTGFRSLLAEAEQCGFCRITENAIEFRNGPGGRYEGGSRISLHHCQYEQDALSFKTIEFHVLWLEEATEFTEFQIRFLRSRVRMPDAVKIPKRFQIPKELWRDVNKPETCFPRILYTSNPGGPGHSYLKQAIWEPAQKLPPGGMWRAPTDDGGFIRQFIPARLTDNPSIDRIAYAAGLAGIGSPEYVRALLDGDWSVILGSFFSELREPLHLIPDHIPPPHCFKYVWYDWGFASPAACLWAYISDGEPLVALDGTELCLPKGHLCIYRELYFAAPGGKNKGAQISNRQQARMIRAATGHENVSAYLADHRPFQRSGEDILMCPAAEFLEEGVRLVAGEHPRETGWSLVHTRLQSDPPMLGFMRRCAETWRCLNSLQSSIAKPEDCDSAEDHLCLAGDTLVDTAAGQVPIADLVGTSGLVMSHRGTFTPYHNARCTRRNAETWRVTFQSGKQVTSTPDHRFMRQSGEWAELQELKPLDRIKSVACAAEIVQSIQHVGLQDVYCLTAPATSSFTVQGGVVVHNCDCVRGLCTVRPLVERAKTPISVQIQREWTKKPSISEILEKQGHGQIFD